MTTSESYDFTMTGSQIVRAALRKLGILAENEVPTYVQTAEAIQDLNLMVKSWATKAPHLWANEEVIFLPTNTTQQSFTVSSSTSDHVTFESDFIHTEVATAASSGDTTITVDSATGMATGDYIGVVQTDTSIHWTSISSISGADITIDAALTADVAVDRNVYTYTSKAPKVIRIEEARLQKNDGSEIPLSSVSYKDYFDLPSKDSSGNPNQFHYNPSSTTGKMYIWPTFDNVNDWIQASSQRYLQDFDADSNNPDFPQEWLEAIIYNLAVRIAPDYRISLNEGVGRDILALAEVLLEEVVGFDQEIGSIYFAPNYENHVEV